MIVFKRKSPFGVQTVKCADFLLESALSVSETFSQSADSNILNVVNWHDKHTVNMYKE